MAKANTATNNVEEQEIRQEGDYKNAMEEYEEKKGRVDLAVEMICQKFWKDGFKERRALFDTTHLKLIEVVQEKAPEDYDSVEDMKALNKAKLNFSKAMLDFDNYIADVQKVVNVLFAFCDREDLPLFEDIKLMTASFSRKTGKISMKKA